MILFTDYLTRLGCAFLTGTLIGVERQYRQRNAGLRTNVLVSVGAAAFTVLSYAMTSGSGDPSRVAAQIVSGIGFLGGGLILKDGVTVRGLNTAATIWCSAACGTLSGVGLYKESALLVACVLITHCIFRPLCLFFEKRTAGIFHYSVHVECPKDISENVRQLIMDTLAFDTDVRLNSLFFKGGGERIVVYCEMETLGDHKALLDLLVSRLRSRPGVSDAGWEKRISPQEDF
ncbi:MgtC/SapB family protein [Parabacteroides timonensis]|uniref:MgtC/SapB family protein n=1 Tax=Parabacteroides timonensis TaxID=1871013 RepID=UPI00094E4E79|nr:MgtC/SapB family protein [Parabacteroides timonensis]